MSIYAEDENVNRLMFKEITSTKPLPREEEEALFKEYKKANHRRREIIRTKIITANLRFALKSCLLYAEVPKVNIADMMTEAKIGLLTAFNLYDPDCGVKFISYAVWQIRHRFSKYFDGIDMIRIPTHQKTKLNKKRKEMDVEQFDDSTSFFHNITQTAVSLDTPCNEDESDCKLSDVLEDHNVDNSESRIYRNMAQRDLLSIIENTLSHDEATVIKSIYGVGTECGRGALSDASYAIKKSHERVRQIRDRALAKLSKQEQIKDLKNILITVGESNSL